MKLITFFWARFCKWLKEDDSFSKIIVSISKILQRQKQLCKYSMIK